MQKEITKSTCKSWLEVDKLAKENCEESCYWYHSSWSLFRCLDVVVNPFMFYEFYKSSIEKLNVKKIAIVGTADITTPYLISKLQPNRELTVMDICQTPLKICERYMTKENLDWKLIKFNILEKVKIKEKYDLIVNDAFITLFSDELKPTVVKNINTLLQENGLYVTTLRKKIDKHESNLADNEIQNDFVNVVMSRSQKKCLKHQKFIEKKAKQYTSTMTNYHIDSIESVETIFKNSGFEILEIKEKEVFGESGNRVYIQVVAKRKKDKK